MVCLKLTWSSWRAIPKMLRSGWVPRVHTTDWDPSPISFIWQWGLSAKQIYKQIQNHFCKQHQQTEQVLSLIHTSCEYDTNVKEKVMLNLFQLKIHHNAFNKQYYLKEHYRIGIKQKWWKSQLYIKLTRSNDDDSRKHPLKYVCLKCHTWWEINNLTLRLEFIAQWAFYSFLFWHRCNAKFVIGFSLVSRDPDGWSISNFYRFVSLCIWWIT